MACSVSGWSCSLCPWCATDNCPSYVKEKNEGSYWIYFLARKGSTLDVKANLYERKEILPALLKLVKKNIPKKYLFTCRCGELVDGYYPNYKAFTNDLLQIKITNGKYNWYTSIDLLYNVVTHEFFKYIQYGTDLTYSDKINGKKPWNQKIIFRKS